jgi:hypothetical protein
VPPRTDKYADLKDETNGVDFDNMVVGPSALVPADEAPPTAGRGVVYRTDTDFDQGETALPRLRLAQGLTAEVNAGEAKPGQWVLSGFDAESEVIIIPLMRSTHRTMRDGDNNILCSSPDAVQGYGNPGILCATCPHANWKNGDTPRDRAPDCDLAYGFGAWSVTHESLVSVDFAKTAVPTAQLINTILKSRGMGKVAIELSSGGTQGPRGTYYKPKAKLAKGVTPEDFETAGLMAGVAQERVVESDDGVVIDAEAKPVTA